MIRIPAILLLILAQSGISNADGLGRLFFTPEQRKQLDANPESATRLQFQPAEELQLNGIVQSMDGTRTIWINGLAQIEDGGGQAPDIQVLRLQGKEQTVTLRVGQRLMPEQDAGE